MEKKLKLVVDVRMLTMSGIGTYLQNILPFLIKHDKLSIICIVSSQEKDHPSLVGSEKVICDIPILSIKELFLLHSFIPEADVFWAPNWNIPLLRIKPEKLLLTIHDVNQVENPKFFSGIVPQIALVLMGRAIKRSHRILTVSRFSKDQIVKYFKVEPEKIAFAHLSVKEDYANIADPKSGLHKPYIFYAGNVKPHKNLLGALEAFKMAGLDHLQFVIVGKMDGFKSSYGDKLNHLLKELGDRVVMPGKVTEAELKQYYANASLFFFPSFYEGFGLPLLEAMAFGLPILTSHEASIPEVCGEEVYYTNPYEPKEMAEALVQLYESGVIGSRKDYSSWLKNFSWEKTAQLVIENVYSLGRQ